MGHDKAEISDQVTVLVFKDNYSARTFRIPTAWISRLGILLGILLTITLISLFFSVRYYRAARNASPSRVQDLEQELADLKTSYKAFETKAPPTQSSVAPPVSAPQPTTSQITPKSFFFTGLPPQISPPPSDPASATVSITSPKTIWQGKSLYVDFNIHYTLEDRGNQQGRIVMLARGPESVFAYPDGVLNETGSESLINPERGEKFSVSRFRQVRTKFGPVRSTESLKDVEVLLFGQEGQLLLYQKLPVTPALQVVKPKIPESVTEPITIPASTPITEPATQPSPGEPPTQ